MSDEEKANRKTYNYSEYLQLNKVLDAQHVVSKAVGKPVHDEHLFIITHQAYELWFKQILFEIDSVRALFCQGGILNECHTLLVINRLNRVVLILKLLTEQFQILETMTPLDFLEFRGHLSTASGFQSLQFRLLENKLGIREEFRIKYNQQHYQRVFNDPASLEMLKDSIASPSLFQLVEGWLERTPGLKSKGFHFWKQYERSVNEWIDTCMRKPAEAETDPERKETRLQDYNKQKETFETIFDPEAHKVLVERGDRRLSHVATQGALMISLYRDEPRFHQPFHLLTLLADIDSLMMKWRSNHVLMVQRMIGSKVGTGGSSGYQYLRSTISDRYKVFLDLFNLSAYLVPRDYIPPLTSDMKRRLSVFSQDEVAEMEGNDVNDPASSDDESAQCDEATNGLKKVSFSME